MVGLTAFARSTSWSLAVRARGHLLLPLADGRVALCDPHDRAGDRLAMFPQLAAVLEGKNMAPLRRLDAGTCPGVARHSCADGVQSIHRTGKRERHDQGRFGVERAVGGFRRHDRSSDAGRVEYLRRRNRPKFMRTVLRVGAMRGAVGRVGPMEDLVHQGISVGIGIVDCRGDLVPLRHGGPVPMGVSLASASPLVAGSLGRARASAMVDGMEAEDARDYVDAVVRPPRISPGRAPRSIELPFGSAASERGRVCLSP